MAVIKTLTFNDDANGWTSQWDYEPSFIFSVKGRYFTTKDGTLYEHYASSASHGYFYGTYYPSEVTLVLNDAPSISKTFKTINYEGSNGWEATLIQSDELFPTNDGYSNGEIKDVAKPILSMQDGEYIERGVKRFAGFRRKENKYYADLVNNSVISKKGQIREVGKRSGVKGFFLTVTMATDESTRVGGQKQLFAVSSEYVKSLD